MISMQPLPVILLVATMATGCVTVAGNRLPDLERTTPVEVPRIEQTIGDFSFHLDGGKMITSIKAGRIFNDEVLGRWRKWGYVSSQTYVKSGNFTGSADYEVTLSGRQNGESSIFLQILSGLTLYVIPHYIDEQYDVTYEVRDRRTDRTWRASVSDDYNVVISLLLLPASPFAQGGRTRTWDRIAANLYDQLRRQGAFAEAPVAASEADRPQPDR